VYEKALRDQKLVEMEKMSFDDLVKAGLSETYKGMNRAGYKEKFKKRYGVDPNM
jgi:hypothetical protein